MIYKKDYNRLVTDVEKLLEQYAAVRTEPDIYWGSHRFYIDTPCGELRVTIDAFKPKRDVQWMYTHIERPELVRGTLKVDRDFDKYNGKYNKYMDDCVCLYNWLKCYLDTLFGYCFIGHERKVNVC